MNVSLSIGSKCALLLPRETINPQVTPAKGLIINRLLDHKSLVLIEEVWQFRGLPDQSIKDMCISSGRLRSTAWGWMAIPQIVEEDDYLVVPAQNDLLRAPTTEVFERMIVRTIKDFFEVRSDEDTEVNE